MYLQYFGILFICLFAYEIYYEYNMYDNTISYTSQEDNYIGEVLFIQYFYNRL